jgi:DNA-directed RNA polymerase subunit RPC12/RpoP
MQPYLQMKCPQCQKDLRVRSEYINRRVTCKHCQHTFMVTTPPVATSVASAKDFGDLYRKVKPVQPPVTPGAAAPSLWGKKGFWGTIGAFLFNYLCPRCNESSGKEIGRVCLARRQEVQSTYDYDSRKAVQKVFNVVTERVSIRCEDCGHEWDKVSTDSYLA